MNVHQTFPPVSAAGETSLIHRLSAALAVIQYPANQESHLVFIEANSAFRQMITKSHSDPLQTTDLLNLLNCSLDQLNDFFSSSGKKNIPFNHPINSQPYLLLVQPLANNQYLLECIPEQTAQKELYAEAAKFKLLAENVTDVIWTMDLNLVTTYVSPSIQNLTGFTPEEHLKQTLEERFTAESAEYGRKVFATEYQRLARSNKIDPGYTFTGEMEYRKKDGGTVWTEIRVKAVRDAYGRITGIQGTSRDISRRKKTEQALRESEQRFRSIYELSPAAISVVDLNGQLLTMNRAAFELLELDSSVNMKHLNMFQFIDPDCMAYAKQQMAEVIANKTVLDIELTYITHRKNKKHVVVSATILSDERGCPNAIISISTDLTSRILAEEELEKYKNHLEELVMLRTHELVDREKKLNDLFNNMRDGAIQTNLKGEILQCNPAFENISGYKMKELLHRSFFSLLDKNGIKTDASVLKDAVLRQGYSELYYVNLIKQDGAVFPAEMQAYVTMDNGLPTGIFRIIRDITRRKQYEISIREKEEKMRAIVHNLRDVICIIDIHGKINYISPSVYKLIGYTESELQGTSIFKLVHPDDLPEALRRLQKVINRTNEGKPLELRLKHASGKYILVEALAENLLDHPLIRGLIITVHDITEKRRAELLMLESERRFRAIFNSAAAGIALVSPEGKILLFNPSLQKMLGYPTDEMNFLSFHDITFPEDRPESAKKFNDLITGRCNAYQIDKRYVSRKKEILWVHLSVTAIRNKKQDLDSALAVITDITQLKRATEQIKLSEEKFRSIFNSSTDGISITDTTGRYLEVNQMAIQRTGLSREQFLRMKVSDLLINEDPEVIQKAAREIMARGSWIMESEYTNTQGRKIFIEIRSRLINYEGKPAFLHITRDITDRKMFEQQLVKIIYDTEEKERNRFARELHDGLGALLSGIKMYVNLLHKGNIPDNQKNILFEKTKELVSHAVETTRELANNIKPPELSRFGLISTIKTFIERIESAGSIRFYFSSPGYKSMDTDIELVIYRVICELINNTLKYANASRVEILIHQQKEKVILRYKDNGIGFNMQKQLKSPRGMGLQNIFSRIHSLNGICRLTSKKGKGMEAIIELREFIKSENIRK